MTHLTLDPVPILWAYQKETDMQQKLFNCGASCLVKETKINFFCGWNYEAAIQRRFTRAKESICRPSLPLTSPHPNSIAFSLFDNCSQRDPLLKRQQLRLSREHLESDSVASNDNVDSRKGIAITSLRRNFERFGIFRDSRFHDCTREKEKNGYFGWSANLWFSNEPPQVFTSPCVYHSVVGSYKNCADCLPCEGGGEGETIDGLCRQ